jgi:hypothetical protein
MPDLIGHPPYRANPHTIHYDYLPELVQYLIGWQPFPVNTAEFTKNKMELPLFRPAGRERGLGGVSGGKSEGKSPKLIGI